MTGILYEWFRGTLARRIVEARRYPVAFVRLLSANRPRYGGYVVHLAIIMLAAGAIASSFYSVQRDFAMRAGDSATVGRLQLHVHRYEACDVPGSPGGLRTVRGVQGRQLPGNHGGAAGRVPGIQDRIHAGRDSQHAR